MSFATSWFLVRALYRKSQNSNISRKISREVPLMPYCLICWPVLTCISSIVSSCLFQSSSIGATHCFWNWNISKMVYRKLYNNQIVRYLGQLNWYVLRLLVEAEILCFHFAFLYITFLLPTDKCNEPTWKHPSALRMFLGLQRRCSGADQCRC